MKKYYLQILVVGFYTLGIIQFASADTITLTGTVRDFTIDHPDFEYIIGADKGIVGPIGAALGADGTPEYVGPTPTTTNETNFYDWFHNINNLSQPLSITLDNSANSDSRIYTYSNNSFFPIDNLLFGNEGNSHNYHFTFQIHSNFTYQGGEDFSFAGDDDVWVYINDKLFIDLGGVHTTENGNVDLDTLGLAVGQNYSFDLFFAERHTTESTFRMDTSILLGNTPVPEPATMLLFGTGLAGLAGLQRRRKK